MCAEQLASYCCVIYIYMYIYISMYCDVMSFLISLFDKQKFSIYRITAYFNYFRICSHPFAYVAAEISFLVLIITPSFFFISYGSRIYLLFFYLNNYLAFTLIFTILIQSQLIFTISIQSRVIFTILIKSHL